MSSGPARVKPAGWPAGDVGQTGGMHQPDGPSPQPSAPPLSIYLVKQAEAAVRAHLDVVLRQHNMATAQYTALTVLQHREGLSSAQLARRSFVKPQTMHEMVVALERQGLIERRPSSDRRHVLLIRLTQRGRETLARAAVDVDRVERQMIRDLTAQERSTLRALLERCHLALSDPLPALAGQPGGSSGAASED